MVEYKLTSKWRGGAAEKGPGGLESSAVLLGGQVYLESTIALWGMSVGATGLMRSTSRMVASNQMSWFRSLIFGVRPKPTFWSISSWIFFCN